MFWIFLSLGIVNALFLPGAAALGFLAGRSVEPQTHVAAGFLASVFTVFVHSLVFVYFMGSGKSLKDAALRHGLDLSQLDPLPRLRRRAFPWAWAACALATATAILGGGTWSELLPAWIHAGAGVLAVLGVWAALPFELRSIRENGRLIERTRRQIDSLPPDFSEREIEEHLGTIPLGKGLLLTGASVWPLFLYLRFVMKEDVKPFPWFFLASAAGIAAGLFLMRRKSATRSEASRFSPPRP